LQHLILLANDYGVMQVMRSLNFSNRLPALHSCRYLIHQQSSSVVEVSSVFFLGNFSFFCSLIRIPISYCFN